MRPSLRRSFAHVSGPVWPSDRAWASCEWADFLTILHHLDKPWQIGSCWHSNLNEHAGNAVVLSYNYERVTDSVNRCEHVEALGHPTELWWQIPGCRTCRSARDPLKLSAFG